MWYISQSDKVGFSVIYFSLLSQAIVNKPDFVEIDTNQEPPPPVVRASALT